jgi:PAS domain S-box-containing protein
MEAKTVTGPEVPSGMFDFGPSFVAMLRGPEHRFEWVNPAYRRLIGDRDLIGLPAREALPEIRRRGLGEVLDRVYATGEPFVAEELPLMLDRGDGALERCVVSFAYQALRGEEGEITGVVAHGVDVTEQVVSREALAASEAHFRSLIENSHDKISVLDPDGTIRYESPASESLLGWRPDELVGRNCLELMHPDEVVAVASALKAATTGPGGSHRAEHRLLHRDGSWRWFETVGHARVDASGGVQLVINSRDVTDRVRASEALAEREERIRTLVELIPQLVWSTDPDGYHDYFNQRWYDYTGMPRGGRQGWNWKEYLHPDDYERALAAWRHSLETGEPYEIEYRFRRGSDGAYRWFIGRAMPMHDGDGAIARWFGTCTDVHDERMAREASQKNEQRFLAVTRAVNEVVWDWNIETGEHWWSENSLEILKVDAETLSPGLDAWSSRIHPEDRDRVLASIHDLVASDAETWSEEYRMTRGDGSVADVVDRGLVIRAADGTPTQMIGSILDVTERNRLESELRQSQKLEAVGKLAGGIAHDFNNIMAAITNYAEILLEDLPADGSAHADIDEIRKAANRAASLTRQLLAFSRQQVLQPRQVNLNDVVVDMEKMLRRLIGADITLTTRPGEGLALVHADPGQLEQVLVNLVVNARDAMPDGGTLTISTGDVDMPGRGSRGGRRGVELTVSDTGIGMDAQTLARAFEPFFTTKEAGKGTGLGLSTVHGIVTQSGGVIEADSRPGRGTTVRVRLPVSELGDGASAAGPSGPAQVQPVPATVLLVEDEAPVRSITRRALTRVGYRVIEAHDGVDALELLDRGDAVIDVVLTDLTMPRMGGLQMVDEVRKRGLEPAIVFMSGYAEEEVIGKASLEVGRHFLHKPFTIDQLVSAVAAAHAAGGRELVTE